MEELTSINVRAQHLAIAALVRASVAVRQLTARLDANSYSAPVSHLTSPQMVRVESLISTNAKSLPLAIVAVAQASVAVRQLTVGRAVNLHMEHALQLRRQHRRQNPRIFP